jgi:hypothetical protein
LESHFLAFVGREAVLKIRASFPPGQFSRAAVDSFVTLLLPAVPPPYSCRLGESNEPGITVSTTQARSPEEFIEALDSILAAPPNALDFRAPEAGTWRTVPRFDDADPESSLGSSPGVIIFARVSLSGDSATASITAQDACLTSGSGRMDTPSSVAGMILAVGAMAALDSVLKTRE